MGSAKDLIVKVIPSKVAVPFVKAHHYSGKVVNNSNLHFGVFYEGRLHGVMSFGPSLDKSKIQGLVEGTGWNEFIELNRMAFDDALPRNSESRAISIAMKLIRKNAPQIKWVISFADGCQCGDGTIYRASGFVLTGYSSGSMWKLPDYLVKINGGSVAHRMKVQDKCSALSRYILERTHGKNLTMEKYVEQFGGEILEGKMFRYIYFIDKTYRDRLTVPIIPFSKIDEMGAGMYKGEKVTQAERHNKKQPE
nr:MAG TPA: protein of unknown function (DUF4338) [Caudoviricetes sp.]